jgi:hypothetical protein
METTAETTTVEREIAVAASPATVWEFPAGGDPGADPWLAGEMS